MYIKNTYFIVKALEFIRFLIPFKFLIRCWQKLKHYQGQLWKTFFKYYNSGPLLDSVLFFYGVMSLL